MHLLTVGIAGTTATEAETTFLERREAEKRAEHTLMSHARHEFKIKKRNERFTERGANSSDPWREIRRQERRALNETRRQARLIVSQGARYIPSAPEQDPVSLSRPKQAQTLSVHHAPRLHREMAFRLRNDTPPDALTISRTSPGRGGRARMETASKVVGNQYDGPMDLDDEDGCREQFLDGFMCTHE